LVAIRVAIGCDWLRLVAIRVAIGCDWLRFGLRLVAIGCDWLRFGFRLGSDLVPTSSDFLPTIKSYQMVWYGLESPEVKSLEIPINVAARVQLAINAGAKTEHIIFFLNHFNSIAR